MRAPLASTFNRKRNSQFIFNDPMNENVTTQKWRQTILPAIVVALTALPHGEHI